MTNDPLPSQILPMHQAARCLARCKGTGKLCQSPALQNGRCRLHGFTASHRDRQREIETPGSTADGAPRRSDCCARSTP